MGLGSQRDFSHRVWAANRAISARFSGVSFLHTWMSVGLCRYVMLERSIFIEAMTVR
jgi:hypothetical protein